MLFAVEHDSGPIGDPAEQIIRVWDRRAKELFLSSGTDMFQSYCLYDNFGKRESQVVPIRKIFLW